MQHKDQTYQQMQRGTFADRVAAQYKREHPETSEAELEKIREVVTQLFDENGDFIGEEAE